MTPLMFAAFIGHVDTVTALAMFGADVNAKAAPRVGRLLDRESEK